MFSIRFEDANLKDSAQGLVLNVTSDIDDNQISVSVESAKVAFKLIPGETNKITLAPASDKLGSSRSYYLDLMDAKIIQKLHLDIKYHENSSITTSLQMTSGTLSNDSLALIPLKPLYISDEQLMHVDEYLDPKPGHYLLQLKNTGDTPASLSFRFSLNNQLEIEQNGLISDILNSKNFRNVELLVTEPGELKISLFTCRSPHMEVYLSNFSFIGDEHKNSLQVMNTKDGDFFGIGKTYIQYFNKAKPVYLRIDNLDSIPAEFNLVTNFEPTSMRGAPADFFLLFPIEKVYPLPEETALKVEMAGPAIADHLLKKLYPNITNLVIKIDVFLYLGPATEVYRRAANLDRYRYCSNLMINETDLYNGSVSFRVPATNLLQSQQPLNITMKLNQEAMSKVSIKDISDLINTAGAIFAKVKVDVFEEDDFNPVATFFKMSNSTMIQLGTIAKAVPNQQNILSSTMFKILLIFITLLVMVAVLFVFYLCANKISGGYRPMSSMEVDANAQTGKALELVDGPGSIAKDRGNFDTLDVTAQTV